jgi:TP901 family phage tail tape measure protein
LSQTSLNILVTATTAQAKAQLTAVNAQMKAMAAQAGVSGGAMGKMGKGAAAGAAGVAAIGVAAAVAGKQLYDLGQELDDAYDTIRTGTGATGKELERLKGSFKSVASTVPNDFKDVGDAIANLNTRLDLTGKPLESMARNMLNLSRMTETDLKTNIESVAVAFKAWEIPAKNQVGMLNGLYRVGQKSGATVDNLAKSMQKFSSPLRAAGFELDDAAAMFASFQKAGVNVSTMMPGFKLAMGNLTAPTDALTESLKQLNINTDADPMMNFQKVMDMLSNSNKDLTKRQKEQLAVSVFGKRATIDFMDAIRQGRFEYGDYVKVLKNGNDTIGKTARDTNDAGENLAIFWNKLKIAMAPVADWIYAAVGDITFLLSEIPFGKIMGDIKRFMRTNEDWKDAMQAVGWTLRALADVFKFVFRRVIREQLKAALQYIKSVFGVIKGLVQIVSGVLTGDFGKAWSGVKRLFKSGASGILAIVRGVTAPMRGVLGVIKDAIVGVFESAWSKVEGVFSDGANAVMSVVRSIVDVINKIPGVDINLGTTSRLMPGSRRTPGERGLQRGGMLLGGAPSGDSIPALLERGEYVLNRKAVEKVGVDKLDNLNFKAAARFQTGGRVGMIRGGIPDALEDAAGTVAGVVSGAAGKIASKGASFFINLLPKPSIPEPFAGTGPYVIDKVTEFIKKKLAIPPRVKSMLDFANAESAKGYPYVYGGGHGSLGVGPYDCSGFVSAILGAGGFLSSPLSTQQGSGLNTLGEGGQGKHFTWGVRGSSGRSAHTMMMIKGPGGSENYFEAGGGGGAGRRSGWNGAFEFRHMPGFQRGGGVKIPSRIQSLIAQRGSAAFDPKSHNFLGWGLQRGGLARMASGGRARMQKGGWTKVGATIDPTAGQPQYDEGYNGMSYAELLVAGANAGLRGQALGPTLGISGKGWVGMPMKTPLKIRMPGKGAGKTIYKIDNGSGQTGNPHYKIDLHEGIANALGWTPNQDVEVARADGKGGGGKPKVTASQKRVKERKAMIDKLRTAVKKAKTPERRQAALWDLVGAWGKYGNLDKGAKTHMIQKVAKAARVTNPLGNIPVLSNLATYLRKNVDVHGKSDINEDFVARLRKAETKGTRVARRKRKGILSDITGRGVDFPLKGKLRKNKGLLARMAEDIQLKERDAGAEWGPGGSEYTDAELKTIVSRYRWQLKWQQERRDMIARTLVHMRAVRDNMAQKVKESSKPGSPLAWKRGAFKKALSGANQTIKEGRTGMTELIGLTGKGGAISDTRFRLKELGQTTTTEGNRDAELASLLREQLNVANRNNAILSAQMPIYQQFLPKYHSGGIIPGRTETPIMAMGGEGVFTREQMAAMGSQNITVIVEDGAVDSDKIRVEVDGVLARRISESRRSTGGRKFALNG